MLCVCVCARCEREMLFNSREFGVSLLFMIMYNYKVGLNDVFCCRKMRAMGYAPSKRVILSCHLAL
jgi:hypothetical protein